MNKGTIEAIINIICLALSHGMDSASEDKVDIHMSIINYCLDIITHVWEEKAWYNTHEFELFTLKLFLENIKESGKGDMCLISTNELYGQWNRSKKIFSL